MFWFRDRFLTKYLTVNNDVSAPFTHVLTSGAVLKVVMIFFSLQAAWPGARENDLFLSEDISLETNGVESELNAGT